MMELGRGGVVSEEIGGMRSNIQIEKLPHPEERVFYPWRSEGSK